MSVNYDLYEIRNVSGNGERRCYARPLLGKAMSPRSMSESISRNCSLKPSDVEAVLVELGEMLCSRLASGHRVYLPEIGYFGFRVSLPRGADASKVRGWHLRVGSVTFRAHSSLLRSLRQSVSFERAQRTMRSRSYTDEEMEAAVKSYLGANRFLTRRVMESEFHLRRSKALQWLSRLVDMSILVRGGVRSSPVYYLR